MLTEPVSPGLPCLPLICSLPEDRVTEFQPRSASLVFVESSWLPYWRECFLQGNDKRGEPHNYCWTYLLKHIEQIHRIQIKRWQFTSPSSLLSSTEVRTLALHAALWQARLLEVNRLHEGFTCWASAATKVPFLICWGLFFLFLQSFWSHINKHVHTLSTYFLLLDWSLFFYWTLHSDWLQCDWIHLRVEFLMSWSRPNFEGKKLLSFFTFRSSTDDARCTSIAITSGRHSSFFSDWYSWDRVFSGKKFKYLHIRELQSVSNLIHIMVKNRHEQNNTGKTVKKKRSVQSDKAL